MEMSALFSYHLPHHFSATHFRSFSFLLYLQLFLLYLFIYYYYYYFIFFKNLFHGWSDVICCCLIFYFIFIKSWFLIKPTLFGRLESLEKTPSTGTVFLFSMVKIVCLFVLFVLLPHWSNETWCCTIFSLVNSLISP